MYVCITDQSCTKCMRFAHPSPSKDPSIVSSHGRKMCYRIFYCVAVCLHTSKEAN